MTSSTIYWTLQAAIQYGGGFYRRLAEATLLADPDNRNRVFEAFPEIIQTYGPHTTFYRQLKHF